MPHEFPSDAAIEVSQFRGWQTFVDTASVDASSLRIYEFCKRGLDLVVTVPLLVILSPFLAIVGGLIKLSDRGSAFFVQERVGRGGHTFRCYKFRSMVHNAEQLKQDLLEQNQHDDQRTFKIARDPRITRIGRLIRKTSIDELPQLWNVIRGDMSLVGPRPPVPSEVNLYSEIDRRRLDVLPGITCIWQVTGRGDLPFAEQVRLDLDYIQNRNLLLDLKLLALTVPAVISGRGAY